MLPIDVRIIQLSSSLTLYKHLTTDFSRSDYIDAVENRSYRNIIAKITLSSKETVNGVGETEI